MRVGNWTKGMDNVHEPHELASNALVRAINVDITDTGKVRRRRGHTLVNAMSDAHSLWDDGADNAYFVRNNQLYKLLEGANTQLIGTVQANLNHLSYVSVHDTIYFTSKNVRGRIKNDVLEPWGIETPATPPQLAQTAGNLDAGTYFGLITYVLADGRESGASTISRVDLTESAGIATLLLPIPVDPAVTRKRLYLTTANGLNFYMAKEVAAADQFIIVNTETSGAELRTQHLSPLPNGIAITYSNGRIFVIDAADPRVVKYTLTNQYDHTDVREKYYLFPEPCNLIAGTKSGLYIGSGKAVYYIGNAGTAESSFNLIFNYGTIAESARIIPGTDEYIWMTERGAMVGHDGGQYEILANGSLVTGFMDNAASMVREKDGLTQYVVVGNNTEASSLQVGSYAEAEITRRQ